MNDADVGGRVAGKRGGKTADQAGREPDFEASLRRLEAIVGRLEAGELPLEETLRLFEEGQALVRGCGSLLERAEQRVKELVEGTGETRDLAIAGTGGASAPGKVGENSPEGAPRGAGTAGSASGGSASSGAADREGTDA
jgi:exodeoxyribonuclease VII small subunit